HRALQRDLVLPYGVEELRRQRLAELLERDDPGVLPVPLDAEPSDGEDVDHRVGHFRADAVAGNQGNRVSHYSSERLSARSNATRSSSRRSDSPNAARVSLSMSISPSTSPSSMIGTTISERVSTLHAR